MMYHIGKNILEYCSETFSADLLKPENSDELRTLPQGMYWRDTYFPDVHGLRSGCGEPIPIFPHLFKWTGEFSVLYLSNPINFDDFWFFLGGHMFNLFIMLSFRSDCTAVKSSGNSLHTSLPSPNPATSTWNAIFGTSAALSGGMNLNLEKAWIGITKKVRISSVASLSKRRVWSRQDGKHQVALAVLGSGQRWALRAADWKADLGVQPDIGRYLDT